MEDKNLNLIQKLKVILGMVENDEVIETPEETPENVELNENPEETPEEVVETPEEVVETPEEVKAAITPEEQTAIVAEIMQILEPRLAALEEAMLMMGTNYKKENEELKSEVQKLAAQPGGEPVKTKFTLPDGENALLNIAKNKKK